VHASKWALFIHRALIKSKHISKFFFFFSLLFPENLPRKSKPLCWPSLLLYRRGRNREEPHKICMNKGACKEGTACTNSDNNSLCTPSSYFSAQPHTILLCFPLFLPALHRYHSKTLRRLLRY
jgi:hypothetical protein